MFLNRSRLCAPRSARLYLGDREFWKEQTLLNVVRLRYGDAPTFVDVSSVISGYTFQGQVSAGAQFIPISQPPFPQDWRRSVATPHIDRPTITYTPLSGDKFARSLLRPLPPSEVFELVQAGYPADDVLLITTRAVNGIYNRSGIGARAREADPTFHPLLDALRRLQLSGGVSIRLVKRGSEEVGLLILSGQRAETVADDLQFLRKTLGITTDRNGEVTISFGLLPRGPNEIAILTRSMAEILLEVAAGIEVPYGACCAGRNSHRDACRQCGKPSRSSAGSYPVVSIRARQELRFSPLSGYLVLG